MRIGVYTIHADTNFGAQIQAYATQRFLKEHGLEAEIVNVMTPIQENRMNYRFSWMDIKGFILNIMRVIRPSVRKKICNMHKFHSLMSLSKRYFSEDEYIKCPQNYDVHLVGSDQVWNIENVKDDIPFYFLSFLPKTSKKVSYASSFGCEKIKEDVLLKLKNPLSSFSAISVREKSGAELVSKIINHPVKCVLDPTFLLNAEQWNSILPKERIYPKKYILYYGFDNSANSYAMISETKRILGYPLVGVSVSLTSPYRFDHFEMGAGPLEFLRLIRDAEFVVTSSFHGMALSINFQKNFLVLKHGTRMTRMESALETLGIENRIAGSVADVEPIVKNDIDYKGIANKMAAEIQNSKKWFLDSLNKTFISVV